MLGKIKNMISVLIVFIVCLMISVQASALDIVAHDGSTGAVTFTPDVLITPIITAIITTIGSIAVLFLIVIGCRWVFRLARGSA